VGEGEDAACSSRYSKFAVHDDANLLIGLETFEANRMQISSELKSRIGADLS
jgi:hypothetical protein